MHNIYKQKHYINNVLNKLYMLYNHLIKNIKNYDQFMNKNSFHTLLNAVINFDMFSVYIYMIILNNFQM